MLNLPKKACGYGDLDSGAILYDEITGDPEEAHNLGVTLAERLLSRGAGAILEKIYG